jgi:hypothetical protein
MESTQLDALLADMRDVVDQLERVDIDDMRRRLAALEELLAPPDPRPVLRLIQGGRLQKERMTDASDSEP